MADRILLYHATDRNFQAHNFSFADVAADNWSPNFTTCGGAAWRYPYIYFLDIAVSPNVVRVWEHEEGETRSRETTRDITLNGTTDEYRGIAITNTHLVACNKTQKRLEYYLLSTKAYDATKNITFTSNSSELEGMTRGGDHLFVVDNGDKTIYKRTLAGAAVSSFTYSQAITMHTIFATTDRLVGIHRNSGFTSFWNFEGAVQSNPPMFGSGAWEGSYVTFDVEEPNAPTSPFLTATSQTELQMQWTLSTDDGGTPITGHQVRIVAGTSIPANTQWVDTESTDTEHTFTGLTPGTQYTAQVRPVNLVGPGAASASASGTTSARITVALTAPSSGFSGTDVTIRITAAQDLTSMMLANLVADVGTLSNLQGSGKNWTATLTLPSGTGDATVTIAEDALTPLNNAASVSVAYAPATMTLVATPTSGGINDVISIAITLGRAIPLELADMMTSAGTLSNLQGSGKNWTVDLTLPATGMGKAVVTVSPDFFTAGMVSVAYAETAPPPMLEPEPKPMLPSLPNAATELEVELTPTTALVKWKAPTNGASLQGYEISYAEGSSPGTMWIPTGSTKTRFLVKGLKRETRYTFAVRGVNDMGPGDASSPVTERTPIASLHNALFFKECVNYFDDGARVSVHGDPTHLVRAVGDNNYKTFTREKDLVLNIAVGGNPTRVDAIFVKGIDIEGHSAEPTGGSGSGYRNRRMPATVKNWEGTEVSTIVSGFQHDLFLLDRHFTATEVRMTFTGANAKITEIALLEFGLEIDANGDFLDINSNFVDREGVVQPDPGGGLVYDAPIGSDDRDKWEVDYVVKIVPGKTLLETPEEFLYWQAENRNHFFFMEPSRFPWRGFPAVFVRKSVPVKYRTDDKLAGEVLNFRVAEQ